jgi:hypothetical protein
MAIVHSVARPTESPNEVESRAADLIRGPDLPDMLPFA